MKGLSPLQEARRRTIRPLSLLVVAAVLLVAAGMVFIASADTPIVVTTLAASDIVFNGATLNGNLSDLGTTGTPPTRVAGPTVSVGPGFNTVGTIDTTGSNFLLIIVGGCGGYDGTLNSVTTSPINTVKQLAFSGILVPGNEGNVSDAFFVTNPSISVSYQVTAAWSAGSCGYGSKYVTLYTFSGVDVAAPMVNNGNTTANAFNGFSPFTTSFGNPASHQIAIFTEVVTDDLQNFNDIHLVAMTGLTSAWTYGSAANCANTGGWCPSGGLGNSRTAHTNANFNIDLGATSWFINGTTAPRTSVDVYFQWGSTVGLGNETTHVAKTSPQNFAAFLTGLNASTLYYFRACASSPVTCSTTLSFTTPIDFFRQITWAFWILIFLVFLTIATIAAYKLRERL